MNSPEKNRDQTLRATDLALVLPLPPSINHQYATVQGRRVLSRASRDYKQLVAEDVRQWMDNHPLSEAIVTQFRHHYLSLTITFYFVTVLRRDLDGGLKIAQDALCEALGVNDNLVAEIHLLKRVDRYHPRIEVLLITLPDEAVDFSQSAERHLALRARPEPRPRRRRLRKLRSLEELASRYNWE